MNADFLHESMEEMVSSMLLPISFFMFVRRVIGQVVLEKENNRLRKEREILKKAAALLIYVRGRLWGSQCRIYMLISCGYSVNRLVTCINDLACDDS